MTDSARSSYKFFVASDNQQVNILSRITWSQQTERQFFLTREMLAKLFWRCKTSKQQNESFAKHGETGDDFGNTQRAKKPTQRRTQKEER